MHQNSPFWDTNYKNFLGRGLTPLQTHRVPSILDHTIIWWNYNHVKIEDDTGLNANDAWRIAHNRKSSKALRPVAGQAFQWVSEWVKGAARRKGIGTISPSTIATDYITCCDITTNGETKIVVSYRTVNFNVPECLPGDDAHAEELITCEMSPAGVRKASGAAAAAGQWVVDELLSVTVWVVYRCMPTLTADTAGGGLLTHSFTPLNKIVNSLI